MKLRAIRVASVGPFSDGVAIENMSGELNLLVAPNETGKSSIFRALSVLFRQSYTANNAKTRALQPGGSGSPLVEVDFDIDGRQWRLTKRWFGQKSATLTDVATGQTRRGADAETEVANLIGGTADRGRMTSLLWVEQNASIVLPAPDDETAPVLARLVEGQIASAVGSGQARAVRALVNARLDSMLTGKRNKAKAGTEYAKAEAEVWALRTKRDLVREQASAAAERMQRLASLRDEERLLADPVAVESRARRLSDSQTTLQERREAARALDTARLERKNAEAEFRSATEAMEAFATRLDSAVKLAATLAARQVEKQKLADDLAEATREAAAAHQRLVEADAALHAARTALGAGEAQLRRTEVMRRRTTVTEALTKARAAASDLATAEAGIVNVDPEAVRELKAIAAAEDRLRAELGAAAPRVAFDLDPAGVGRIRVAGRAVDPGEILQAEDEIEIVIEGIGRIRVAPGGGASLSALRGNIADLGAKAAAILARLALPSLEAAEAVMRSTAEHEAAAREARARLQAHAPRGLDMLMREAAELEAEIRSFPDLGNGNDDGASGDLGPLLGDVRGAEGRFSDAQRAERAAAATLTDRDKRYAILAADVARDLDAAENLSRTLPPEVDRAAHAERLRELAERTRERRDDKVLAEEAWKARAPSPEDLARLEAAHANAADDVAKVARRLEDVRREMASVEGALARDGETGSAAVIAEVEAELEAAEARVERFERDCQALTLLDKTLEEVESEDRETLTAPVRARLDAYAGRLMPGIEVLLGDAFAVRGINRWSRSEAPDILSMGTVEQLGLLSRLAFARLLADRGVPVPVVFDDPLVHADDDRIATMFEILREAASHHQIVLLSCHAAAFGSLGETAGANRLRLSPWQPLV